MSYMTQEDITERVIDAFRDCGSPRLKELMQTLVRHLHAFARETKLTNEEWLAGVDFLYRAGAISDPRRNEFMLLSDTLGLSALVELLSDVDETVTPSNHLGPFYVEQAPDLPFNADLRGGHPGEPTLLQGRVLDRHSRPIAGASINMWQTQDDGLYDVQVHGLNEARFRGWMRTGLDGAYQVRTIKPLGYTVPMDGPVGEMLVHTSRSEWRPAHWHFLIRAEGYRPLITELYPRGAAHLHSDVAFGAREELLVDVTKVEDAGEAERCGMPVPFCKVEFDFKLAPV